MAEELYFGQGGGGTAVGGSFTAGASTGGNTAGTTGTVSNGVLFFGGANITLSESSAAGGASLSIIGGAGAAFSGGVSSGGNSAGTTGTVGNGIRFFGGNNITLSQSSAAGGATISFVGPNTSAQQTGISGIAGSGASTVTNGTVQFGNANNMSFGLNGSTMTGSFSQSIQTQGSVQINGSTGAISFNAGNNMSLSTVASNLTFINVLSSSGIAQNVSNVSSAGTQSSRYALADHAHIGLAGVNASGTASTFVGNLMLSGANLTLVTGGNSSAGSIGFSVAAQTVESQTMGMSNLGNTSGTSGVASGGQVRMLFAGGNNITLSQSVNGASATITISGGAGGAFTGGVSTGGNTAGTTGTVNNGILFYGGANVTLSQSSAAGGATVSIVGGAGGAFSGGVSTQGNTSGTTGTVGNGIVFVGGNNITLSQSSAAGGATVTISAPSGGGAGVSTGGNTAGTTGTVDYQLVFVGGSNISLSQSVNGSSGTITINGASGGGGGFQSAGISTGGNTAGTTGFASSQILFYGGANITLSQSLGGGNASLSIIGGAGAGGVAVGMTNTGNTSGTTFSSTSGTMYFQGTNNVTVSNSSAAGVQTLWISGPTGGGAGMGTGANTSGTSGTVGKELYFYGGANISLSQSVNGSSASLSIIGGAGAGGLSVGNSTIGNTLGETGVFSNRVVFAGGNNITLSGATNTAGVTFTISGANVGGAQTGISGIAGSAASTVTAGTVQFANSNNISFGLNGSTMTASFSVTNAIPAIGTAVKGVSSIGSTGTITRYAPEDHQHAGVFSFGVSNIGNTVGNTTVFPGQFILSGGNNITLSQATAAGNLVTIGIAGADTHANIYNVVSASGNTTGTLSSQSTGTVVFAGGANITLSQSSNTITIIGGAGGGAAIGMTNTGNTSGTTFSSSSGTMYFQGTNNVTVSNSSAAGAQTLWISGPSGGGAGMGTGANTSGTSGTVGDQLFFYGGANISLSQSVTSGSASLSIIGAAQTVESQSFGASNLGNTQGTSGMASGGQVRFAIVGSNNITLSQSINGASGTISIIGGAGGAFSGGVSTGGNTAGSTGTVGSQIVFVGTNGISLSQSTNGASATISISGGGGGGAAIGMTNTGNTSGTTFSSSSGTMYFQGTNNVTVSNSSAAGAQTLWISGPTGGGAGMGSGTNTSGTSGTVGKELYIYANNQLGLSQSVNGSSASLTINGEPLRSKFYWMPEGQVSSSAITMGSASFQPVMIPYDMSFTRVDIPLLIASTSSATTNTCALVISSGLVIYSISNNSTLNPITGSFGTTTHTFASNTAGNQSIAGARYASFALGTSLSAGWYVIGFQMSTANTSSVGLSTTAIPFAMSILLGSVFTGTGFADIGSASAATTDIPWGRGVANSTITATNATMNINGITQTGVSKFRGNFHVLFRAIS